MTRVFQSECPSGHVQHSLVSNSSVMTRISMERESKAELMKKWREEQKEKKKDIKKAYYEKNKAELIQNAAERKKQKAVASKTRAECRKRMPKRYRDKKKAAEMMNQPEAADPGVTPDVTVFKSQMGKKRAVDKTRKVLPATPSKKVEVMEKPVKSPNMRKALQKKDLINPQKMRKKWKF